MNYIHWTAVAALISVCSLHAQTPTVTPSTPVPAAAPTMDQTIAFINESLAAQGQFTYNEYDTLQVTYSAEPVRLDGSCHLSISVKRVTRLSLGADNCSPSIAEQAICSNRG